MGGLEIGLLTAFVGGLLSFLSPCVLPLAPPYLAFLAGTTLDQIGGEEEVDDRLARRVFYSSIFFVLGLATVFVALGATASLIGQALAQHKNLLAQIGGVLIIAFGLHFLGVLRIPFLFREARFDTGRVSGGYLGAYLIGLAFAFGWTPCVGPILGGILFMAAQEDTIARGIAMLAIYAAGLGAPFILAALFVRPFMRFMKRFRRHMGLVEKGMGVLLIGMGLAMITGVFSDFSFWLIEMFPALGTIG